jgi:hypothetical protein
MNEEKKSKSVYVGKEKGEPIPAPVVGACIALSGIFVLTFVCLIIIWSVTR